MNEIEKLYKNAGVEMQHLLDINTNQFVDVCPLFTAEKQIELIKWISHHDGCFEVHLNSIEFGDSGFGCCSTFEESFARAVNNFLKSATEEERKQIKEMLK